MGGNSGCDSLVETRVQDDKLRKLSYKSHYWRYVNAFIGAIAGLVGLVYFVFDDTGRTSRVWNNIQAIIETPADASPREPAMTSNKAPLATQLSLSTNAAHYHVDDRFDYRFAGKRDGYVSLWNITASGRVQRITPSATNRRAQRVIAGRTYTSGQNDFPTLLVSGSVGVEQLLLLWCPQRDGHGFSALFPRSDAFERDLMKRRAAGCRVTRTDYRIVAGASPAGH